MSPVLGRAGGLSFVVQYEGHTVHHLPHFHVKRGNRHLASVDFDGNRIVGHLTRKEREAVDKWLSQNRFRVLAEWEKGEQ